MFLTRNNASEWLARWGVLLTPCAISCSLSVIFCIYSFLFSDWRHTVSLKFFDTQVSLISIEELVLPRHAYCMFSRLHCNRHSVLLSSYLSRIGRIKNPSCSARGHPYQDTFHLILHCLATDSLASLCLSTISGSGTGEFSYFLGSGVFCHASIRRKGLGSNNNSNKSCSP